MAKRHHLKMRQTHLDRFWRDRQQLEEKRAKREKAAAEAQKK
jgi:hypothetical protein